MHFRVFPFGRTEDRVSLSLSIPSVSSFSISPFSLYPPQGTQTFEKHIQKFIPAPELDMSKLRRDATGCSFAPG